MYETTHEQKINRFYVAGGENTSNSANCSLSKGFNESTQSIFTPEFWGTTLYCIFKSVGTRRIEEAASISEVFVISHSSCTCDFVILCDDTLSDRCCQARAVHCVQRSTGGSLRTPQQEQTIMKQNGQAIHHFVKAIAKLWYLSPLNGNAI